MREQRATPDTYSSSFGGKLKSQYLRHGLLDSSQIWYTVRTQHSRHRPTTNVWDERTNVKVTRLKVKHHAGHFGIY